MAMHDILKERVWRKLQALPQEQLYQVLDYMEFLEEKYARERAAQPDALQKFAERLEDGMRFRSVAPKVISGTVGLLGSARRVLRTVSDAGREFLADQPADSGRRLTAAPMPPPAGSQPGAEEQRAPPPAGSQPAAEEQRAGTPPPPATAEDESLS
jgi:hypothetical protein